jgi:hypothetical protein
LGLNKHLTAKNPFYPRNYTDVPSALSNLQVSWPVAGGRILQATQQQAGFLLKNMHASADSNNILRTAHLLNSKLKQKNKRKHSALVS